ncbi:transposase [Streptomyces sp. C10-9-1]|uniref:transposase n=1 Tax=Streptomyces sp. C10-9-1 TaxID=1859285 RepID=UPI003F49FE70
MSGAWLVFRGRSRILHDAAQAATWSQRGRTPVVRVRGRSRRRVSIAALTCYKPGQRSRLIYRPRRDDGQRDGRKSFSWRDYRDLLIAAHQQLGGPIVLVWDILNVHKAADLREWAQARDWLTIYYLPRYAPDLNPVEGVWSLLRRGWSPTSPSPPPNTSSSASDPVPRPPHGRLPRRNRPDHQTRLSSRTTSRVQSR